MKNLSDTIHIVNIVTTVFKIFKDELFRDVRIYCTRPQWNIIIIKQMKTLVSWPREYTSGLYERNELRQSSGMSFISPVGDTAVLLAASPLWHKKYNETQDVVSSWVASSFHYFLARSRLISKKMKTEAYIFG
jgi:hypothetical protein